MKSILDIRHEGLKEVHTNTNVTHDDVMHTKGSGKELHLGNLDM